MLNFFIVILQIAELRVTYDYSTGIVATTGIQICGLQTKPLPSDVRPISFDSVEYVPLSGTFKVSKYQISEPLKYSVQKLLQ